MLRTPRSARRRALRQQAAKVPGVLAGLFAVEGLKVASLS